MGEKRYWLHRVTHCYDIAKPLLDMGYLSIGFADFLKNSDFYRDMMSVEISDDDKWKIFEEENNNVWKELRRTRYFLWKFLTQFSVGDVVLVPGYGNFSIYKIVTTPMIVGDVIKTCFEDLKGRKIDVDGTYLFVGKEKIDIGFVVGVELIHKDVSRYDYAGSQLTSSLKYQGTNCSLVSSGEEIEDIIKNVADNKPINVYADAMERMAESLLDVLQNKLMSKKFEYLVEWYFKEMGASYTKVLPTNHPDKQDLEDADVTAEFDDLRLVFYIQAKHHKGITDSWAVEQIGKYKNTIVDIKENNVGEYQQYNYWVISTCDEFDDEAKQEAARQNIRLINGLEFSRMLINAGIKTINDAFVR